MIHVLKAKVTIKYFKNMSCLENVLKNDYPDSK